VAKERPGTVQPSAVVTDDPRRGAILNAAFCLLMQHGYERTSTRDIASRAKVQNANFTSSSKARRILSARASPVLSVCVVPLHAIRPWSRFTDWRQLNQSAHPRSHACWTPLAQKQSNCTHQIAAERTIIRNSWRRRPSDNRVGILWTTTR
jgi:hypothetical protein